MRLALWGAGNTLVQVIDEIDRRFHSIEYLIDSNVEGDDISKWGIPVRHYSNIDLSSIDSIVITTKFQREVLDTIEKVFPDIEIPVFLDMEHFLAWEYVNIIHKEILENPLYQILAQNQFSYNTDKRLQYLEIYDRYFSRFRDKEVVFLEIGVYHGGSLKLWKEYFGSKCKIIGVDINPDCEKYREEQVEIEIGSQESGFFWEYIKSKYPRIDIVLDDGGHTMKQQITTFTELFPCLSQNGIYMCEDVFTSYWGKWGGNWQNQSTFVEFVKGLVDHMNTKFAPTEPYWNNHYVHDIKSICFHQGICVMEKDIIRKKLDNMLLRQN